MIKKQKGVALLWTLIISMVLLTISGTMVNFIIKDSRFSINIEDSIKAYAAAKTGLDWGSWYKSTNPTGNNGTYIFYIGDSKVTVYIDNSKIESSADTNGVHRKLRNVRRNLTTTPVTHTSNLDPNTDSFNLQFDFWTTGSNPGGNFGLDNGSAVARANPWIYMAVYNSVVNLGGTRTSAPGDIRLVIRDSLGRYYISDAIINLNDDEFVIDRNRPYNFRATLEHREGSRLSLQISERVIEGGTEKYISRGSKSLAVTDSELLGNLKTIVVNAGGTFTYTTAGAVGDGEYLELGTTSKIFIDKIRLTKF